jgi:hypothetical protein
MQNNTHLLKYGNLVMLVVFVLCIVVQFNDWDAYYWVLIYGLAALLCLLKLLARPVKTPAIILGMIAMAWLLALIPRVIGETTIDEVFASITMQTQAVEEAREIGGLLIVVAWMFVLWRTGSSER